MTRKWKTEKAVCRIFSKWAFLKYPQKFRNTHRKIPMLDFLPIKVVGLKVCNFTKKRLQYRYFTVDIAKFSRTPFFREHFRWLLLSKRKSISLCKLEYLLKTIYIDVQKQWGSSVKKRVLKNFNIFTGKYLCWSFCCNKAAYFPVPEENCPPVGVRV